MIALALALLISTAPPAGFDREPLTQAVYAQFARGLPPAKVGEWVSFKLHGTGGREAYWRFAVVSKAKDAKGRDAVWVEMELDQHPKFVAPLLQMKLLVASQGGLHADGISRAILAVGAGKPQEVDPASLITRRVRQGPPAEEAPFTASDVHMVAGKPKLLMTPAGTVRATPVELRYRQTVIQRYWLSKEIPVLQLAKIEIPDIEDTMEVRDYGLDAKPQIHFPDPDAPKITLDPGTQSHGGNDAPAPNPP